MARPRASEFDLIARHFAPLATSAASFGLRDDAASIPAKPGHDLVVTKDAIVAGVHFLPDDPWDSVAQKLLRVNLSDLAAKGAVAFGYLLGAAFPNGSVERDIARFARGLARDQARFGVTLLGGDTVATPGPLTLSCTMFGWVKSGGMLRRSGVQVDDEVWVTGVVGDAGMGLRVLRDGMSGPARARATLAKAYRVPQPPVSFGRVLPGLAHAAIDVSDGLLQDAGHLAATSGVQILLDADAVPLSSAYRALAGASASAILAACCAGDDYQILFAAPRRARARLLARAAAAKVRISRIGRAKAGSGVVLLGPDGQAMPTPKSGYTHF